MSAKDLEYLLLALPAIIFFLMFRYLPMAGAVLAFKDFRYNLGLFRSPWVGFKNFEFFFTSQVSSKLHKLHKLSNSINSLNYGSRSQLLPHHLVQ